MFKKYKSWYDLTYQETIKLENEFIGHDMGKDANDAMHLQVIIGIVTFVLAALLLVFFLFYGYMNPYLFTILILFILFGAIIVVVGTIEYHIKFNSWLKVTKNIIKK